MRSEDGQLPFDTGVSLLA